MKTEEKEFLRGAAVRALRSNRMHKDGEGLLADVDWQLQTSNSFRRIGSIGHGDGDVLRATTHPLDHHPDLSAPPGVLDYIVAAQPRVVLALLDELQQCEETLALSRKQHAEDHAELESLRALFPSGSLTEKQLRDLVTRMQLAATEEP